MTRYANQTQRLEPVQKRLPTMYDLPSENPEEPGLPDEFHDLQPELLSATLRWPEVKGDRIFTGTDLNLYFDLQHPLWYKRPDWFVVVGVPRLYAERDMRMSYVVWDEGVSPTAIVELLSEGTDKEDLGLTESIPGKPPTKWVVYEQILNVPHYVLYDRHNDVLRAYRLENGRYQAQDIENNQTWMPDLKIGLGLWQGEYKGIDRKWLRWLDADGTWIPTPLEQAEAKAARLAERLRELGIDPDKV
ncbi:MAG: Uma2 family endonuclease [Thermosynechococcaceae cyanobacterium]